MPSKFAVVDEAELLRENAALRAENMALVRSIGARNAALSVPDKPPPAPSSGMDTGTVLCIVVALLFVFGCLCGVGVALAGMILAAGVAVAVVLVVVGVLPCIIFAIESF